MPSATAYPLMRARRRHPRLRLRLPSVTPRHLRAAAVLALAAAVLGALLWASRPGPPDPRQALAEAELTLAAGNYHAARANAERAVAAAPGMGAAQLVLARALVEIGEGVAAEAALGHARAAGVPDGRLRPWRAQARLLQGDAAGALALVTAAGPADGEAVRARALAAAAQGQGAAAQALLEARVAAQPNDARAWTSLGRLRLDAGEMGGAADAAANAARLAPGEPAALTLQGEVVRTRFGLVAALPWFDAAVRRDAYYHPALIEQAATLGELGRYAEALAATRHALVAEPGSAPALYLQAAIAMRAGEAELALKLLDAAGTAGDAIPGALLVRATADAATGRWEEAVTQARRLLTAQPMNLAARRLLAAALLRTGDAPGALDVVRPLALRADADAYTLVLAARGWEAAGDRGAAATFLDRAGTGAGVGGLFATDDALGALTAEAAGAADDPTYALGVIRGLAAAGNRTGALAKARALAAATPRDPAALLALGDASTGAEALTAYRRAADLQFDEPTLLRLVDAFGRAGQRGDAARALALYMGQNPQSLFARRLLGEWQVAAGEWDAAIETLEGMRLTAGARDAGLLAALAVAYAGADDGVTARRYGAAAYALLPTSAMVADAYGVALAADGEVRGARQLLDKAIALAPGNAAYLEHRRQLG